MPDTVVHDVRRQIEASAQHLIDVSAGPEEPEPRYAAVTRVHVLCILRGTAGGRYSRWYRDSHYLHHVITRQVPPDLGDCENILVLMFWMGMFPGGDDGARRPLFLRGATGEKKQRATNRAWTSCCDPRPPTGGSC